MSLFVRTAAGGTGPAIFIEDLGYTINTGASWTSLTQGTFNTPDDGYGQFTSREIRDSIDLFELITAGFLEYSTDGYSVATTTYDPDIAIAIELGNNYLNLTQGALTLPNSATPPSNPAPGQIYYDTVDGYLQFFNANANMFVQISQGSNAHGALSGLLNDDHPQYLLLAGTGTRNLLTGFIDGYAGRIGLPTTTNLNNYVSPVTGEISFDTTDGYLAVFNGTSWQRDGYNADHGELVGLLDDDHPQYALLTGDGYRNHVTGTFNFSDGYLTLPVDDQAPVVNVFPGAVTFVNDLVYVRDGTRSKWLSVSRNAVWAGRDGYATNIYLRTFDGIASSVTGYRVLRNATITSLVMQSDFPATWIFEVRINDSFTPIASLASGGAGGNQDTTISVDVSQGDQLQFFCNGVSINRPLVGIELAWRI